MKRFLIVFFVLGLILFSPATVFAYYTNMPATVVIGQPNFTSATANNGGISASTFSGRNAFTDGRHLFVADSANNRVLIWNTIPITNFQPADVVLGQPNFVSSTANNGGRSASTLSFPLSVTSDGTKVIVADRNNTRVLIWNNIPTTNQQPANVVIWQTDFSSATSCLQQT